MLVEDVRLNNEKALNSLKRSKAKDILNIYEKKAVKKEVFTQTSLFELTESEAEPKVDPVIEKIKEINPLEVTPMEALNILYNLKKEINNKK